MDPKNELPDSSAALFTTCLVDQIMPEVGPATVRLLRRTGRDVVYPERQTCCGQPFYNSGFWEEARRLAKHTIEVLEPYPAVVLPSGSCTAMIRQEYSHLLEAEPGWGARAKALGKKTFELTEFLAASSLPEFNNPGDERPATYHDSCHLCRNLGIKEQPRQALNAAGFSIKEMAEPERCCGFGGVFSVRMPEASGAMRTEKLKQARHTGTGLMVTADPGCLMHIRGFQGDDSGLQIRHIAEALEEASR